MDNLVTKSILPLLVDAPIQKGKSKVGNDYYYILFKFNNGYEKMILVDRAMEFPIRDAFQRIEQNTNNGEHIPVAIN